ncbi:MAG: hypothetical protein A2Z14_00565 [Chloroflexi bacterium RBG_16_48_8]|nr:MAG: hypothetical protein A2Z14_00565 [Chloroflexi bacterium RBG_16_48_8]
MLVKKGFPTLIERVDTIRYSPHRKFIFIAAVLIALLLLTVSLWNVFQNENNRRYSGSFLLVETGEVLYAMNLPHSNRSEYCDKFHFLYTIG